MQDMHLIRSHLPAHKLRLHVRLICNFGPRDRRPGWAITERAPLVTRKWYEWERDAVGRARVYGESHHGNGGQARNESECTQRSHPPTIYIMQGRPASHTARSVGPARSLNAPHRQAAVKERHRARRTQHTPDAPAPVSYFNPFTFSRGWGLFIFAFCWVFVFNFPGRFFAAFWVDFWYWAKSFYVSGVCHCAMCARWLQKKSLQGASWESKTDPRWLLSLQSLELISLFMCMFTFISQVQGREPRNCIALSLFFIYVAPSQMGWGICGVTRHSRGANMQLTLIHILDACSRGCAKHPFFSILSSGCIKYMIYSIEIIEKFLSLTILFFAVSNHLKNKILNWFLKESKNYFSNKWFNIFFGPKILATSLFFNLITTHLHTWTSLLHSL